MDNILIYDRPNHQVNPNSDVCDLHTKKIRRQKIVGKKGKNTFNFNRRTRRYMFEGIDPMAILLGTSDYYRNDRLKQIDPIIAQHTIDYSQPQSQFDLDTEERQLPF